MSSHEFAGPETAFKINISDDRISLLRRKLKLATFPDEIENAGRDYGPTLADIKRLADRWQNGYDWKKYEAELNDKLPQFKRTISVDGHGELDIHYVHQKSTSGAIPLLFVHGWPGSFFEVAKILPFLTRPEDPTTQQAFHLVALSLPGFGFSSAPKKKGFGLNQFAEVGHKLMLSLGYEQYGEGVIFCKLHYSYLPFLVTQGGDWGAYITKRIAILYGHKHSKAWHINYVRAAEIHNIPTGSYNTFNSANEQENAFKSRTLWFEIEGRGYNLLQSTQPQTPGYALADSPVGLLAWIYEKLVNWSDRYLWEDDEVLNWISIYWFSAAGPAASLRIYYERTHEVPEFTSPNPTIPLGVSLFPQELSIYPKAWLQDPNLVFTSEHKNGGHFAAHENPIGLITDLRAMFGRDGPAFGVLSGFAK
ncbi:Alpha/Beta hydrolase protein [Crepidotus variabilis]|uniref:Alpha/Beta hydrolase protein n=1 Tax=Crepidotus variabilis TaxID=179855 RepID=A0A9P6EJ44_9AGAR|nr:Alpha/Beta hydrolase protein [Crepidotus variabilis]